ncbi:metallohydrolase [Marinobacter alkaliphilus]|uniref:Metallohydrolase n=1 Tax=Marinobacter alkaliphilus TaxID=254719 RepID=A0ABZ3DXT1_9GAMM|tara:strand:+ start:8549 stop:9718 length:1170 start_codon:yes stop_codon:yes gene_type:complete
MNSKITFFPVDNGDMTLLQLADDRQTCLLIDCRIRRSADDPSDTTPDVAYELRKRIKNDARGRPFVDAMLLSHPDEDHCLGLRAHFWLGPVEDYPDDDKDQSQKRIIIRELWSSPMVFRRASKKLTLCDDAKAFSKEARRRVQANRDSGFNVPDGDRILILGQDKNGKTEGLEQILVRQGDVIRGINGMGQNLLESRLLAPFREQDEDVEEELSKNDSSVVINFSIRESSSGDCFSRFLSGGDSGVCIWERLWREYTADDLKYDLLLAPHHCSWRSLSHDSWSDNGNDAEISEDARSALAQANDDAFIVSSSKPVVDDDNDPPCIRAKREYKSILGSTGIFKCTGEEPTRKKPEPIVFQGARSGFRLAVAVAATASVASAAPPRAGSDD